ncbi:MAG: hypothetical protein ABIP80_06410 [Ferruginibacter sp.]
MNQELRYVPVLRCRQQENIVLKSFNFGKHIYPCIEITKEIDRLPQPPGKNAKKSTVPKALKKFEEVYVTLVTSIKAEKVFVDLPVHINYKGKDKARLNFFTTVIRSRAKRTEYMEKLSALNTKVIPVISTYAEITNERGSLQLQEQHLRSTFKILAFRTFMKTFHRDYAQIKEIIKKTDYLIMDWEDITLDLTDDDQFEIVSDLQKLNCTVITLRNSFPIDITNSGLEHGKKIDQIDNTLPTIFQKYNSSAFADYCGIKKDALTSGGVSSPGAIYYDAADNEFYGFRYKFGSHKLGDKKPDLQEFVTTIVPAILKCDATKRMQKHHLDFLGLDNIGWKMINDISDGKELGRSAAKFKRIAIEHYLHCIKKKIENGDFET